MFLTVAATIAGFVLVFIHVGGWSEVQNYVDAFKPNIWIFLGVLHSALELVDLAI